MIEVYNPKEAVYEYEHAMNLKDGAIWGARNDEVKVVSGKTLKCWNKTFPEGDVNHFPCYQELIDECLYIFHLTLDEKKYVALRVSMHPKTAANIYKGSMRYGHGHILSEL